jgi:hypothetical protein
MNAIQSLHTPLAAVHINSTMRIVAIIVTALLLGVVLELVRRRRLVERYALLWMVLAGTLLLLAVWTNLLGWAADRLGIHVAANALFAAGLGVTFLLLLHFSVATSRLSDETKILAQEVARLDERLRAMQAGGANGAGRNGEPDAIDADAAGPSEPQAAPAPPPSTPSGPPEST